MKISIKYSHLEGTSALEQHVFDKFEGIERHLGHTGGDHDAFEAVVELARTTRHHQKGDIFSAAISFHTPKKQFHVEEHGEDLYAVIDHLKHKLRLAMERYKEMEEEKERT